jgi:hypothetical protein
MAESDLTSSGRIENKIFLIRGKRVMLDEDLAWLYDVETKQLIRQVKRNIERFPEDFMFQLTKHEYLRCQNGTSSWGGRRTLCYAFTEQGISMLSSVLRSKRAILVNINIMRAFVALRRVALTYTDLKRKIETMENKYDDKFKLVFEALKRLLEPPPVPEKPKIGFHPNR